MMKNKPKRSKLVVLGEGYAIYHEGIEAIALAVKPRLDSERVPILEKCPFNKKRIRLIAEVLP